MNHVIDIPGYRIEKEIGQGGMSTVYLAVQESLDRPVALKVMAPALSADPTFGERFQKEARTVARLTHPNIVAIYDIGSANYLHYMAVEYVSGGDIRDRIKKGMTPEEALEVLRRVAVVLAYAHEKGYVHRDIKPENILFREDGTVVLTDFGIAKVLGTSGKISKTGMGIGTPHYMSPEQARGKTVDGRSDLYSLGVVFFEMLINCPPYDAEDSFAIAYAHVNDPVPELPPHLSNYQPLIDRLMAKNPDDRFPNAAALVEAIDRLRAGGKLERPAWAMKILATDETVEAKAETAASVSKPRERPVRRSAVKWAVGGLFLVILLAAGFFLYSETGLLTGLGIAPTTKSPVAVHERSLTESGAVAVSLRDDQSPGDAAAEAAAEVEAEVEAEDERRLEIERLLDAAEGDIAALHLTDPEGDNALEKYRRVLELDPGNVRAREGMVRIVARHIERADAAMESGDLELADSHVKAADSVLPGDPSVKTAAARLAEALNRAEMEKRRMAEAETERKAKEAAERDEAERRKREAAEAEKRRNYDQYITVGLRALERNEPDNAIAAFKEALALYADDTAARQGLERAMALLTMPKQGETFKNDLGMNFVFIAPGSYYRGSPESEEGRLDDETLHKVTLNKGFWMQTVPVTQALWKSVMGRNPSHFSKCDECPVEQVSWNDIQGFIEKINSSKGGTYRLPTEAEWEYAARAGSKAAFFFGDDENLLGEYAWYAANSENRTHPVGRKRPSPWGLYDIYGNVSEWCHDWRGPYPEGHVKDPKGPPSGSMRIIRGGSWFDEPRFCRSAFRNCGAPEKSYKQVGFRLVRDAGN